MAPRWTQSSEKHGLNRRDQMYAIIHATYRATLPGEGFDDGVVTLYIGPQHPQTEREIEVLVNVYGDGRESVVFHAMHLGPKFYRYREENPHD